MLLFGFQTIERMDPKNLLVEKKKYKALGEGHPEEEVVFWKKTICQMTLELRWWWAGDHILNGQFSYAHLLLSGKTLPSGQDPEDRWT